MRESTHNDILLHLKEYGSITGAEAYEKYRCYRLSSVINRLRRDHIIETLMCEDMGRHNKKSTYAKYLYWGEKEVAKSENT